MKNLNNMAKRFNTTGNCNPKYHYMVNIDDKLEQIEALINNGLYFTLNRARQFGKTTTMDLLYDRLSNDNVVYHISFETDADMFSSQEEFCKGLFMKLAKPAFLPQEQKEFWAKDHHCNNYEDLSSVISEFCTMKTSLSF